MKNYVSLLVLTVLLVTSCASDDSDPTTGGGTPIPATATYEITFTPDFTSENYPTDYPSNPQFSGMLIAAHDSSNRVFSTTSLASAGLVTLAETGENGALESELTAVGSQDEVNFKVVSSSTAAGPTSPQTLTIVIEPEKTLLSFVAKLSPSPDWFVGVNSFNLVEDDNSLVEDIEIGVGVYDAGTDSGASYESEDEPTNPAQIVSIITTPPLGSSGPSSSIGTLRIQRID